jgi:8-oxo-dGTP pyrophosphatase MutT (NUDIX family)
MQISINYNDQNYLIEIPDRTLYAQEWVELISEAHLPREIKDALLVRLADEPVDMYGRTLVDNISTVAQTGQTRYSVQVHPYPWRPTGASNVAVYKNEFNELFVALVYNIRRDKRSAEHPLRKIGVPYDWRVPEGYEHPPGCPGAAVHGIAKISSDDMDEAEELKLKKRPLKEAYQTIAARQNYSLPATRMTYSYDKSLKDCAMREIKEEIGLQADAGNTHFVAIREDNALVGIYLIDASTKNHAPPDLKIDNLEIAHALWGKLKAFQFKRNNDTGSVLIEVSHYDDDGNEHAIEVPLRYALTIGQGIQYFRNQEIQSISNTPEGPFFSTRENVEAKVARILKSKRLNPENKALSDILGISPETYLNKLNVGEIPTALATLGHYAQSYHHKILWLAEAFKNAPVEKVHTAVEIIHILNERNEIEQNTAASKVNFTRFKSAFTV